jgi:cell wall assembly regulator SMI1
MSFEIVDSEAPVTPERIAEVERLIGVELPTQYKSFLLKHNGGAPVPDRFPYRREGKKPQAGMVAWFLAIYDGKHENLVRNIKAFQGRIPVDTLPIARDPGGNLILLGLRPPLQGKVFFWTKELESDDGTPTEPELLYHVADSFEEFLTSLGKV